MCAARRQDVTSWFARLCERDIFDLCSGFLRLFSHTWQVEKPGTVAATVEIELANYEEKFREN